MSRKSELPKSRHHIMLYDEDWDFLEANYGKVSATPIGASAAISAIVHAKVRQLKAKAAEEWERQQSGAKA